MRFEVGQEVRVKTPHETANVRITAITPAGTIISIRFRDGEVLTVHCSELVRMRKAAL